MQTRVTARPRTTMQRPYWLTILAGLSLLLSIVTTIPQFYYVLYYTHLVVASPHANFLGQIWYWYGTHVDTGALSTDSGTMAGALEDAFILGPLYFVTALGLWRRRPWVIPVGLITGAMIGYAILYFVLTYTLDHLRSVTDLLTFWLSILPYLVYPIWLIAALLTRRSLFPSSPLAGHRT